MKVIEFAKFYRSADNLTCISAHFYSSNLMLLCPEDILMVVLTWVADIYKKGKRHWTQFSGRQLDVYSFTRLITITIVKGPKVQILKMCVFSLFPQSHSDGIIWKSLSLHSGQGKRVWRRGNQFQMELVCKKESRKLGINYGLIIPWKI